MVRVLCFNIRSKEINKTISGQGGIAAKSASFTLHLHLLNRKPLTKFSRNNVNITLLSIHTNLR